METIAHNPANGIYAASPDYIHALEVRQPSRLLFVSGTMGLDQRGMAAADLDGQLELIWFNLRAILSSADMTVDNIVRLTSYLSDGAFMEANQNARLRALGGRAVPTTAIIVETLRDDWLVEIEIIAAG
ncbi:RidA family protein [Rhizobium leguminosarum]|uniref:RidA family protein n=1 Tax=Rhizobium leguminosarum TaxID=384 RepID=UPI001C923D34|nr:RidA family protein [Rhizobium leguminosarum]MBY2914168.1 RidA family protein [Rhizobium leguminosarum]MBY2969707.1 RidA family protein [Rhizobium leguminosarum]MBY2977080.1 RidA family protein [Rhizobium leguminosarum]MBY3000203.1 RidA family protein [Rhizobium leguminosarum]MBY3005630.1 RidA family protein [Rhizobium leguminosarum]